MIILDTDHVSFLEWGNGVEAVRIRSHLQQITEEMVATTIISFEEQTRGWLAYVAKSRTVVQQVEAYRRLRKHLDVYRGIYVLDFDENAAMRYQQRRTPRIRVGTMDLRIAAIALTHDALLLSRNLVDFAKVPGLRIEDWTI